MFAYIWLAMHYTLAIYIDKCIWIRYRFELNIMLVSSLIGVKFSTKIHILYAYLHTISYRVWRDILFALIKTRTRLLRVSIHIMSCYFYFRLKTERKWKKKSIAADKQHTYLLFSWFIKVKVQRINGCLNKLQWFVDTVLHGRQNIINTHIHIQIIHAHIMLIVDIFTLLLCWHTIDGCRCRSHSVK